jgi:hypothetical protein
MLEAKREVLRGAIQLLDFVTSEITGHDRSLQIYRLHDQCRQLSHARADIEAAPTRPQPAFEHLRQFDAQPLTTPALCLPKFLTPLVAIDLAEEPIIQLVKDVVDRLNSLGLQSMFHQGMNGPVSQ